jgi:hypothetical protein
MPAAAATAPASSGAMASAAVPYPPPSRAGRRRPAGVARITLEASAEHLAMLHRSADRERAQRKSRSGVPLCHHP